MTCASRQAFIELAATGAEPLPELRAHLRECHSCRSILERERNLFSVLDAGLRASAQVEIPASLLPRVRSRLDAQPVHTLTFPRIRAVALALAAAAALLLSINSFRQRKQPEVSATPPSTHVSPPLPANDMLASSAEPTVVKSSKKFSQPAVAVQQPSPHLPRSAPEIIVSPDQEVLLARYANQLNQRRNASAVVSAQSTSVEPQSLEMDLIQIAQLDVQPLAEQLE